MNTNSLTSFGKGLVFVRWNAHSVTNKITDVVNFIQKSDISLFAITESHLQPDRDFDNIYKIPQYQFFRQDRDDREGGGIITYIHHEFSVNEIKQNKYWKCAVSNFQAKKESSERNYCCSNL